MTLLFWNKKKLTEVVYIYKYAYIQLSPHSSLISNGKPHFPLHFPFLFRSSTPRSSQNRPFWLLRPCKTLNDCSGQLICINGKCNDDPEVGTNICKGGSTPSPTPTNTCKPAGTLTCQGKTHTTYNCSPQVTAATSALLTLNDFSEGGDGGGPSECDEKYHDNSEPVVALSTGWYNRGSRCGKMISITASNGRSVTAKVVDECDSMNGCDKEHAGQPPCRNNIVDGSAAVWNGLGLNQNDGVVKVTWSMA